MNEPHTRWKPRVVRGLAIAAVAALLAGCNPTSNSGGGKEDSSTDLPPLTADGSFPDDGRAETLTWSTWNWADSYKGTYTALMDEYSAADPRVEGFDTDVRPYPEYHDALNVAISGNRAPDVGWIHGSVLDSYIDGGRLVDLRPIIETYFPDFDLDDFDPATLANFSRGDALYAIPNSDLVYSIVYNRDLFEQAGIETPLQMVEAGTWTWDNLRKASKALVDSGAARYGLIPGSTQLYNIGWHQLSDFYAEFGGSVWSDDKKTCTINEPGAVEGTQLLWDMVFTDKSMPGPEVDVQFPAGDIGMSIERAGQASDWADAGFNWDMVRMPDGPEGFIAGRAQDATVAFVNSDAPDLGAIFAAFTGTKAAADEYLSVGIVPRKSIISDVDAIASSNALLTPEQMEQAVVPGLTSEKWVPQYSHPNFAAVHSQSMPVFDQLWLPGADVQSVLDDVCTAIDPLLSE